MSGVFQYFSREVGGFLVNYPANDVAEQFSDLMYVRIFTPEQLSAIAGLGFDVTKVPDPRDFVVVPRVRREAEHEEKDWFWGEDA
jgi:hypothetical protein